MKKNTFATFLFAGTIVTAGSVVSAAPYSLIANGDAADPFSMADPGHPGIADLDNDGDLDMIMHYSGDVGGNLRFFRNTGSASAPAFSSASLGTLTSSDPGGNGGKCALGDVDGDSDYDLIVGTYDGPILLYTNGGSVSVPNFGASATVGSGDFTQSPALADLDGDGDLDIHSGGYYGGVESFANNGSGSFSGTATPAGLPSGAVSAGTRLTIGFVDEDGDGDYDAYSGAATANNFRYWENTGTVNAPNFVERTGASNPLFGINPGNGSDVTFVDIDGDGDLDGIVTYETGSSPNRVGQMTWIQNQEPQQTSADGVWNEYE